jgi:uncharacterized membrane protein
VRIDLHRVFEALTTLEVVFVVSGAMLGILGAMAAYDRGNPRRFGTGLFWMLLAGTFAFGSILPSWAIGVMVVAMVLLDSSGGVRKGNYHEPTPEERQRSSNRLGFWLFIPVLTIPLLTYGATLVFSGAGRDPNRILYVGLTAASLIAGLVAIAITQSRPGEAMNEGRRLADAIGAAVILPQLLAALGALFTIARVGGEIQKIAAAVVPSESLVGVSLLCCVSLALCSVVMGNSFAAFPVIMAGIGVPLLIVPFGVDPALVGAICMTAASCGTLCTPMAANFNIVPPALFEMKNRYGVIQFQAPFAVALLGAHAWCTRAPVVGAFDVRPIDARTQEKGPKIRRFSCVHPLSSRARVRATERALHAGLVDERVQLRSESCFRGCANYLVHNLTVFDE